jgi:dipeptidyl aminopeptidase/acylaminoacyl peptidase
MPPVLVVHTVADEIVPYRQSIRFAEALDAAGVPHELFLYQDTTHYLDLVNITPETAELYRRMVVFLDRYVRNQEGTQGR